MSAVLPARPREAERAALIQQQHQQHSELLSSVPASPPPPPLPSRNLRRTSCFLDVLLDTTKSAPPTVVTATLATAAAHDVYLSSEEDASSFSSDMSDYNTDEEVDDDNDVCSSSTSVQTTTRRNNSCDGGAPLRTSSPSTQQEAVASPSSPPSAAHRRSRDATARAVSVVFSGKPSLVDLVLERETRRRSVPSLRAAAAAAATPTEPRAGSSKETNRSLRIITEDLPSRLSTASSISRPASASPYLATTASTPTLTPRSSLLFRGVSRTLTLSRRLGRSARRDETRDDGREGSQGRDTATPRTASASSTLPPPRASTPLSAMFLSSPFPASFDEDEQQQQKLQRRKTDAYVVEEGPSSSNSSSDASRPSSAYIRSIPRSQTASILMTPGSLASRKENADGGGRFLSSFSGRRRSMKLL